MLSEGVGAARGRGRALLHRDRINGMLRGRRGARITAITVRRRDPRDRRLPRRSLEPDETFVGTVNEDFAIESMAGDVFLLGSHSWRIRRVERRGVVRVEDAQGAPPSIPFWLGEAPGRTLRAVGGGRPRCAATSPTRLDDGRATLRRVARSRVRRSTSCGAQQIVDYVRATRDGARRRARRTRTSSSSASSTRPAACSSSCTRRSAGASTAPWGWRCASASACASTSSCRRRPPTTPSCSRSARSTASRSRTCSRSSRASNAARVARAGGARRADVRHALALERDARARGAAQQRRQAGAAAAPAHARRRPAGRGLPGAGRLPGEPHRPASRSPTTRWSARPSTTACTRRWTSTACTACSSASSAARSACTRATRPSRRRSRTRS